jgi:hypothetical protein
MDQILGVKPQINMVISMDKNMNCKITLCLKHIVTIRLHNYKFILKKHTLLKDTLDQVDLN